MAKQIFRYIEAEKNLDAVNSSAGRTHHFASSS
jgi:hypothetical protein